jgi:hypothetical protein
MMPINHLILVLNKTRLIGAGTVFETGADTPPMRKSIAKFLAPFFSAGALIKKLEDAMYPPLKDIARS